VNESLTKMNFGYIENYVLKEELDKVNQQVRELREENEALKAWKEKALNLNNKILKDKKV